MNESNTTKVITFNPLGKYDSVRPTVTPFKSTYEEMTEMRDQGKLIPGQYYQITDYVTTVNEASITYARSACHAFDLLVRADSANTLNEQAWAVKHDGDTYFNDARLEAWELKYRLDNVQWSQQEAGRGTITWMKDEHGNECPYDFKNVQFKRWKTTDSVSERDGLGGKYMVANPDNLPNGLIVEDAEDFIWAYTFSSDNSGGEQTDYSLTAEHQVHDNVMKAYSGGLPNNVMFGKLNYGNEFGVGCYNNSIGSNFQNNSIGSYFQNNSIGSNFQNNSIGSGFVNNSIGSSFKYNSIGSNFQNNSIGSGFGSNSIGSNIYNNSIGSVFVNNSIGSSFQDNSIGSGFGSNSIGSGFVNNSIGSSFKYNSIGSGFMNNSIGSNFQNNSIGSIFQYNSIGSNYQYNTVDEGVQYTTTGDNIKYVHVLNGVASTSSSKLTLNFAANKTYCQMAAKTTDGVLKIWVPADLV